MFAQEIISGDKMRILVRVTYGYYVIERILQRSNDEGLKEAVRAEAVKNFKHIGVNSLKSKWSDLLESMEVGNTHYHNLSGSKNNRHDDDYYREY